MDYKGVCLQDKHYTNTVHENIQCMCIWRKTGEDSINLAFIPIVLSVLLRYTDSDYPFCIFKLFLSFIHIRIVYHRTLRMR